MMIPFGLQRRLRRAPFQSCRPAAATGEAGQRRSPLVVERVPEDDSEVQAAAR
ncbi:MAG: hypothetical protein LC792_27240 [Actinobacteria bacterium]|nr:hypothetical protein [Actinomycetota bacterium]